MACGCPIPAGPWAYLGQGVRGSCRSLTGGAGAWTQPGCLQTGRLPSRIVGRPWEGCPSSVRRPGAGASGAQNSNNMEFTQGHSPTGSRRGSALGRFTGRMGDQHAGSEQPTVQVLLLFTPYHTPSVSCTEACCVPGAAQTWGQPWTGLARGTYTLGGDNK